MIPISFTKKDIKHLIMKYVDNAGKVWTGRTPYDVVYKMYVNANLWNDNQYTSIDEYIHDTALRIYAMDEIFIESPYEDDDLIERVEHFFEGLIDLKYLTEIKK